MSVFNLRMRVRSSINLSVLLEYNTDQYNTFKVRERVVWFVEVSSYW